MSDPIVILFLRANPTGTPPLRLDQEFDRINEMIKSSGNLSAFRLHNHGAVRPDQLDSLLYQYNPHIVHFAGHGLGNGSDAILLEDDQGQSRPYTSQKLEALFRDVTNRVRCIVLNSCHSKPLAEALSQQIDCVIGTTSAIPDTDAIRFSGKFYEMLASRQSVQTAFNRGCAVIESLTGKPGIIRDAYYVDPPTIDSTIPILFAPRVNPEQVRFINAGERPGSPTETLPVMEPAYLVVIKPEEPKSCTPPYTLSILKWTPGPRSAMDEGNSGLCTFLLKDTQFTELEPLKQKVADIFAESLGDYNRPLIEFLVPRSLISHPFEEIVVIRNADEPEFSDTRTLARHARVVVRFWERAKVDDPNDPYHLNNDMLDRWKMRSNYFFRASSADRNQQISWAEDITTTQAKFSKAANDKMCCLGVKFVPDFQNDGSALAGRKLAAMLLQSGIPVAAWIREEPLEGRSLVVSTLQKLLIYNAEGPVEDIRDRLHDLKIDADPNLCAHNPHIGNDIVLLWDDPRRRPTAPIPPTKNALG